VRPQRADRTHRRELLPVGGPVNRGRPGLHRGTRWPHGYRDGSTFAAGGKVPLAYEAGPLPESFQANGGRCCPHSKDPCSYGPSLQGPRLPTRRELPEQTPCAGLAAGSVNEAAEPNIHNQTNRQENKQRSGTPITHERKRDTGHGHSTDDHRHVY
jgi:hypothetical protein